jgi:hypothetical protein
VTLARSGSLARTGRPPAVFRAARLGFSSPCSETMLFFLLRGPAATLLGARTRRGTALLAPALRSRRSGFVEGDRDGLFAFLNLAPSSSTTALELTVLIFMHHASDGFSLTP